MEGALAWREVKGGVEFPVRIQPRASKNELAGLWGNSLKIRLTAPPVEGEANRSCIDFLSQVLGVPRARILICSGETSRHKVIRVEGLGGEELEKKINVN